MHHSVGDVVCMSCMHGKSFTVLRLSSPVIWQSRSQRVLAIYPFVHTYI